MKTEKRGTLVGEITGGGANPGGLVEIDEHFAVNVPTGRAINPVTKTNWEGTGVTPDVAVPALQARDTAYKAALDKVRASLDPVRDREKLEEIDEARAKLK